MRSTKLIPVLVLLAGLGAPARANDSSAELSVGGLTFTRSNDISMESEELTISPEFVTVRYQFANRTPKPVTLTVAFPLPDIDLSDGDNIAVPVNDPTNFVGFETKVDGKPVTLTIRQTAHLGDKDVTAAVRKAGIPLLPLGPEQARLSELPQATRTALIDQGLMLENGTDARGQKLYTGGWVVKTAAVRQQTFPAASTVTVEHRYRTSVGIGLDTVLRKGLRRNSGMAAEVQRYRKDYCVTDAFLAGLDKMAGDKEANVAKIQERRIGYVLKTGANWAGPIKDFRMVVDTLKPDLLVSFCGDNIKPVSKTAVELRARDFTPTKDVKILIVGRF